MQKNIWETITPKTAQEWINNLQNQGIKIGSNAQNMIKKIDFSTMPKEKKEFDLVVSSVENLGFPDGAQFSQILDAGKKRGLKLCPPWLALVLRQQYLNQVNGEALYVAMKPIFDSDSAPSVFLLDGGSPNIFIVEHSESALRLNSTCNISWFGRFSCFYEPSDYFVFVGSRK